MFGSAVSSSVRCPVRARNTSSRLGSRSAERGRGDALCLEDPECLGDDPGTVVHIDLDRLAQHDGGLVVHSFERLAGPDSRRRVGKAEIEDRGAHGRLQGGRSALCYDLAVIDHDELLGEAVGFFQVLGREKHGRSLGGEGLDHAPHVRPAGRVEPCGRLVEEQHSRVGHERGGDVETAAHSPGIGLGRPVSRFAEAELPEQRGRPLPHVSFRHVVQPCDHPEVLSAREVLVDRGELSGEPDQPANDFGLFPDVVPEHPRPAAVGGEHGREDPDNCGLAGPVRPQEPEYLARLHPEADAVERPHGVAEGLVQILQLDGERHTGLLAGALLVIRDCS